MRTLWAIQIQPFSERAKPWLDYRMVRRTRREVWAAMYDGATEYWKKTITQRRRSGHIRCVKVTLEALK